MPNQRRELDIAGIEFSDMRASDVAEELRKNLVKSGMGVTVIGPHVTLRFGKGERFVQVSMQIMSITDSTILEEEEDSQ